LIPSWHHEVQALSVHPNPDAHAMSNALTCLVWSVWQNKRKTRSSARKPPAPAPEPEPEEPEEAEDEDDMEVRGDHDDELMMASTDVMGPPSRVGCHHQICVSPRSLIAPWVGVQVSDDEEDNDRRRSPDRRRKEGWDKSDGKCLAPCVEGRGATVMVLEAKEERRVLRRLHVSCPSCGALLVCVMGVSHNLCVVGGQRRRRRRRRSRRPPSTSSGGSSSDDRRSRPW
jgi:hypothetical protein